MGEASRNNNTRPITAEDVLKIFQTCGLGPSDVTPRIHLLAELLSSGHEPVTGPEFQRSKRAHSLAHELLDHIESEMAWNSQRARKNSVPRNICKAYHLKLRTIADAITSLNETELLGRAPWASQKSRLRMRDLVASNVRFILAESGCENLTFPDTEDARVIEVTTQLLQTTVEPGANEVTVRQSIKRLKHGEPTRTKKA